MGAEAREPIDERDGKVCRPGCLCAKCAEANRVALPHNASNRALLLRYGIVDKRVVVESA